MDFKRVVSVIQRWAWLLIISLVIGALGSLLVSLNIKPVYQGTTKVLTTRAGQASSTDATYLSDQQLTQTYVQLASSKSIRQTVAQRLGLKAGIGRVTAQQVANTQIIEIRVEDQDPDQAERIADTFVLVLIEKNDELQSGRYTTMEQSLLAQKVQMETQIADLQIQIDKASTQTIEEQQQWIETQITSLQAESSQLQNEIANTLVVTQEDRAALDIKKTRLSQIQTLLTSYRQSYTNLTVYGKPVEGAANSGTSSTLSLLQTTQDLYQKIYLSILNNLESVRLARLQDTPNVVQIDPASASHTPVRPKPLQNTLLGGIAGLLLVASVIVTKETLDDTLKTPDEVEQYTGVSVIGYIAEMRPEEGGVENLYVARQPRSPISEAFRSLRTNLEFSAVDSPLKTIAITSAGPSEGKTTIACNLAGIIAQGGKQVILLDADLRKPRVHRYTDVSNRIGLSDVFRGHLTTLAVKHTLEDVPNLSVVTSGSLPPNPAELLGSAKMKQILDDFKSQADIVIIDCPPLLVADSQVLASKVDGVVIVIYPGHTHRGAIKATLEQLKRAGAKIVGVALNRIPRGGGSYYGGYYSSYDKGYHYYSEEAKRPRKKRKQLMAQPEIEE